MKNVWFQKIFIPTPKALGCLLQIARERGPKSPNTGISRGVQTQKPYGYFLEIISKHNMHRTGITLRGIILLHSLQH